MISTRQIQDDSTKGMRWVARIVGLIANGLFWLFVVSLGVKIYPTLSWLSLQGKPLFCAMGGAALGALIAWRWEKAGGTMAVLGACALSALALGGAGHSRLATSLTIGLPFFIAGTLFLICSWRTKAAAK